MSSRKRNELLDLIKEVRWFIAHAVLFNQRLAERLGINATDYQVLGLLDLRGACTPGDLAHLTGLTTGGVTVALDRLEKAGYIKRKRNPNDRRSLLVRAAPSRIHRLLALYKSIVNDMDGVFSAYDETGRATILDFFSRMNGPSKAGAESTSGHKGVPPRLVGVYGGRKRSGSGRHSR